ncbi:MAG TPA: heavy metal translocating P-type ATPase [Pseudogracilibacillus sp.]|nr:heavy metal translocating P-type ATPase [Pseudogracilibacillus sp.]
MSKQMTKEKIAKEKKTTERTHEHDHDHHHHGGQLALVLFFVGLATFLIGLFIPNPLIKNSLYFVTFALSGYHIIIEGFTDTFLQSKRNKKLIPNVHILMTLAAIGAMIIGEYREAALLILIFAGAHYLEDYAESKSRKEITSLLELHPTSARRINEDGEVELVDVDELLIGEHVSILNGDQIPTDGIVLSGQSTVNEAAITGESIPVQKEAGDTLFGSTINGDGTLVMEVTKDSSETVFAKIIELVSESQNNVSATAAFIKRIEPIYVNTVLILAPLFYLAGLFLFQWGIDDSFYRTMVFLIAASPCALAATDIPATLSAISNLAKRGVLFKGGSYLSNLSELTAVAFDKTGTLTTGKPVVTNTYFSEKVSADQIDTYEKIIVSMESKANHPLADAVLNHYDDITPLEIDVENVIGVGLVGKLGGNTYKISKPSSVEHVPKDIVRKTEIFESDGKTVVYFCTKEEAVGLIAIQDVPKKTSKEAIQYFKKENIHTIMITGDAKRTGEAIGKQLDMDEVRGNVLPKEKAEVINELKHDYPTIAMLGDGVNDAPALVTADIGVAMGEGTDIAIDVADAVLMKNDLTRFAYTHKLAKKLRKIVWQNIIIALTVVVLLVILNVIGKMNMAFAVVIHEGSTLLVILNGLRLLKGIKEP